MSRVIPFNERTRWTVAVVTFVAVHLLLLGAPSYPIEDETIIAPLTQSVAATGQLRFDPAPQWKAAVYTYGPVYFAVTAPIIKWLGLGVVQQRLVALIGGLALVAIFAAILKARRISVPTMPLVIMAFAFDPILTRMMHLGRMDTLALLFVFAALWMLVAGSPGDGAERTARWRLVCAGLLVGAAILTTPRAALSAAPLALVVPKRSRLVDWAADILLFGAVAAILYGVWMAWAFGGPLDVVRYYSPLARRFVASHFFITPVQVPLLLAAGSAVAWALVSRRQAFLSSLAVAALAGICLFYGFVNDTSGLYSIYILPFYYVLLAEALNQQRRYRVLLPIVLLVVANGVVALYYASTLAANSRPMSARSVERFIASAIPPGSRVIGDDMFYFAAIRAGLDYQYMNQFATTVEERERYQRVVYDYEYVLWSNRLAWFDPSLLAYYQEHAPLDVVARHPDSLPTRFWRALDVPRYGAFGITIYHRRDASRR
jgi:hypothetical protein